MPRIWIIETNSKFYGPQFRMGLFEKEPTINDINNFETGEIMLSMNKAIESFYKQHEQLSRYYGDIPNSHSYTYLGEESD